MQQIVKKRGKKNAKISVIQSLTTNIDKVSTPDKLPSNLILHLKKKKDSIIKSDDTFSEKTILEYNPSLTIPTAYDPIDKSNIQYCNIIDTSASQSAQIDKSKTKNQWCWWCCHTFDSKEIKLPISKNPDSTKYNCIGKFCSPECVCAYIVDSGDRYGDPWTQYELLHEMIQVNETIQPAPKRELLSEFGGDLTIEQFRSNVKWSLNYPPMVSLKLQMDDTPIVAPTIKSEENTVIFNNATNSMKVDSLNWEDIDKFIPDKKKKDTKKVNVNGSLDRFWSTE